MIGINSPSMERVIKNINLTGYREAMVFYGSGKSWTGCKLANYAYAKQLLMCVRDDIDPDSFNVQDIKKMFLSDSRFTHLHYVFETGGSLKELQDHMDAFHRDLCRYVSKDYLDYEPEDERFWWSELCKRVIAHTSAEMSSEAGEFLDGLSSVGMLCSLWWDWTDVEKCDGYARLGYNAAVNYGYKKSKYSKTFLEWCEHNCISDKDAEKERLYKLFKVDTDELLDPLLKMNMTF